MLIKFKKCLNNITNRNNLLSSGLNNNLKILIRENKIFKNIRSNLKNKLLIIIGDFKKEKHNNFKGEHISMLIILSL